MPGKAPYALRRRGSDKYFISPANPRASHSSRCSSSGNSSADTTPHRSNPSSLARDCTHTVSELIAMSRFCRTIGEFASGPTGPAVKGQSECRVLQLAVAAKSDILVRVDFKDSEQFGELQQIVDFLCQVQELQASAAILHTGIRADELTDTRAVDVIDIGQVQQDQRSLFF